MFLLFKYRLPRGTLVDFLEHVNGRNLLSDFQSGFRRGHSTATALVTVTEDLRSAKAEGKVTVHVLLDFSKAFDLINHGLFVHWLDSRYDFHTSAMGMFSSFLPYHSMFINDLCSCIRFSKIHFYADDLQIYLSGDPNPS
jgi:hypothetical protein